MLYNVDMMNFCEDRGSGCLESAVVRTSCIVFCDWLMHATWLHGKGKGKKSLHMSQVANQTGAYPGFCSMKRLGVFLLTPGWDASPSEGYPQH